MKKKKLKELLSELANLRVQIGEMQAKKCEALTELNDTIEYLEYSKIKEQESELMETEHYLEDEIKKLSLQLSAETNYKELRPIDGVEIKQIHTVEIDDEILAKRWAIENAPQLVSVDMARLKRMLGQRMEFIGCNWVRPMLECKATISLNLSKYLVRK